MITVMLSASAVAPCSTIKIWMVVILFQRVVVVIGLWKKKISTRSVNLAMVFR